MYGRLDYTEPFNFGNVQSDVGAKSENDSKLAILLPYDKERGDEKTLCITKALNREPLKLR
jgi:hypothetical protein